MKGLFITFEGGEGAGKTTLIQKIVQALHKQGRSTLVTREPGGTELGEEVRDILLRQRATPMSPYSELCLFLASRSQHIREVIQPALSRGQIVLCDRFNDSSIAYQGAGRGLGMEEVARFCQFASEGLTPHLTFYLDIAPEEGLSRAQNSRPQDRIESEALSFHKKIRAAYLQIQHQEPHRFHLLDASQAPDTVFSHAMQHLDTLSRASHA